MFNSCVIHVIYTPKTSVESTAELLNFEMFSAPVTAQLQVLITTECVCFA